MMGINSTRKQKVHSLTGRITPQLMLAAFKAVKRNRGAAGIDKVSIKMFQANLDDNLRALMQDLKQGSFEPFPLRRVFVPKNEKEFRPLGIPAVRDRVAQEVVRRLLNRSLNGCFTTRPAAFGRVAIAIWQLSGHCSSTALVSGLFLTRTSNPSSITFRIRSS